MEKLNLTQQKHTFEYQKKCTATQNKHEKLIPGLVASCDIWTGNAEGLFWFQCFINLSLTYLLRHLPTYLQPRNPCSAADMLVQQNQNLLPVNYEAEISFKEAIITVN